MKKRRYKRRVKEKNRWMTPVVVLALFLFMGSQIFRLYVTGQEYRQREESLEIQIREEEQRTKDLKEYEAYIQSEDYIQNTARTKLGLVNDNEIIFREK